MCHGLRLGEGHIVLLPHLISFQGVLRTGTYGEELQAGVTISVWVRRAGHHVVMQKYKKTDGSYWMYWGQL